MLYVFYLACHQSHEGVQSYDILAVQPSTEKHFQVCLDSFLLEQTLCALIVLGYTHQHLCAFSTLNECVINLKSCTYTLLYSFKNYTIDQLFSSGNVWCDWGFLWGGFGHPGDWVDHSRLLLSVCSFVN